MFLFVLGTELVREDEALVSALPVMLCDISFLFVKQRVAMVILQSHTECHNPVLAFRCVL